MSEEIMVPALIAARVVSSISLRFCAPRVLLSKHSAVVALSNYVLSLQKVLNWTYSDALPSGDRKKPITVPNCHLGLSSCSLTGDVSNIFIIFSDRVMGQVGVERYVLQVQN
jgi:hypothetical protein